MQSQLRAASCAKVRRHRSTTITSQTLKFRGQNIDLGDRPSKWSAEKRASFETDKVVSIGSNSRTKALVRSRRYGVCCNTTNTDV
eukprot:4843427-Amphidinium_carterae.1